MPKINRIRVNNVKYNFGTQFYDDFVMRFEGRNALYDLANGGGKSVLMLLLFQNLIPNCTLDDKQPVEKLFRTGEGSTTIHSLVEWRLDEKFIKDERKYMLTGFCARKAKDDGREKARDVASIDYFNYVIFYKEYNDNDIINLPLKKGNERLTYTGLRSYLRELAKTDYHLDIHIFERKGEYQRFISRYGLYESSWEIIRGINKTEGHVRTWFETNYKTTRKVIEDLLIEEIIQKAFLMKSEDQEDGDMAKTLLEIKDKLLELSKKKEEISGYEQQMEALTSFIGRIETLTQLYGQEQEFFEELVKTYNTAGNAFRQKDKELALSNKEKDKLGQRMEELTRRLETAKIQKIQQRLKECEEDTGKYDEEIESLTAQRSQKQLQLNMEQSGNNYLEYVQYKKNAESVRHTLESASQDSKELLEKLWLYAGCQKRNFDKNARQWTEDIKALEDTLSDKKEAQKQMEAEEKELEKNLVIAQNELLHAEADHERISTEIKELRKNPQLLFLEGSEKEVRSNAIELRNIAQEIRAKSDEKEEAESQIHAAGLRREAIRVTCENLEKENASFERFKKQWEKKKEKADQLKSVYQAPDYHSLKTIIYGRWQKVIIDIYEKRENIRRDRQLEGRLESFQPMLPDEALIRLLNLLRSKYSATCILGCDYVSQLPSEERKNLLKRIPYLPCSIIVMEGYSAIEKDTALEKEYFGENVYPVISMNQIAGSETLSENVLFVTKDKALFYDETAIRNKKEQLTQSIEAQEREIVRLEDTAQTYMEDLEYLGEFLVDFHDKYVDKKAEVDKNCEQVSKLHDEDLRLREETEQLSVRIMNLVKAAETLNIRQRELEQIEEGLRELVRFNAGLEEAAKRQSLNKERQRSLSVRLSQMKLKIEENAAAIEETLRQCTHLKELQEMQDKKWKDIYSAYYKPDLKIENDGEINNSDIPENSEAIEAAFTGLKEAFEQEHLDLEDKRRLLESYEQGMERLLSLIDERGVSKDELCELYEKNQLLECSAERIADMKNELESMSTRLREMRRVADEVRANKNRLAGNVENAISAVEEKYGQFMEVDIQNRSYDDFMSEQKEALLVAQKSFEKTQNDIFRQQKELHGIEDTRKDLERLMRTVKVAFNYTKDFYMDATDLRKRYEQLCERYERLRSDEEKRREAFETQKVRLAETLISLEAYELAEEIRLRAQLPSNSEQAQELIGSINETIQIIGLEKDRIFNGIESMLQIKESFENQCLQRCIDIKAELERLPALSKIVLDGRPQPMLQLKIPYVKEEFYHQRMSEYIDTIVVNADSYKETEDKLKYIRHRLAWKNLFSVIVTDMNSIRLNLYKRERIHEQSRYLKYEEAVGSTGQSQGIYIQFLIAVINYISSIYSADGEGTNEAKVIFIDNPFGAAKDIYIWEPIFELLKTNHVQLIVPARGATPAISGMFDINYVLGQKMIDGKVQTVVVDYYSNVKIEDVEYVKLDFEQQVFDFI